MKFTIERDAAIDTIAHVVRRVKGGSIPILSHVAIGAADNRVSFSGHDGMSYSHGSVAGEVSEPGECVAPGAEFLGLVDRMSKGSHIEIKSANGLQAEVRCGRSHYRIPCLPIADFPPALAPEAPDTIELSSEDIAGIFRGPRVVVSDDEAQINYTGVCLHAGPKGCVAGCATDGHRLVRSVIAAKFPKGAPPILIPRRAVDEIIKTAGDHGAIFSWSANVLSVKSGDWIYATKLLDAQFPDYEKFLPKANGSYFTVQSEELKSSIERLMTIATNRSKVVLTWGGDEIIASLDGVGDGSEHIKCAIKDMPDGDVSLSGKYLLEISDAINGKELAFHVADKNKPFLVLSPDQPDTLAMQAPIFGRSG